MNIGCRIELLGGLRAVQDGHVVTRFRTQKTGALLAYLALTHSLGASSPRGGHRSHRREALVELLWPECPPETGRASLSTALSAVRRVLEPSAALAGSVLITDRAAVQLNPEAFTTDVAEFEAALEAAARAGSPGERAERLTEAVDLYREELLPGYFEDWVLQERRWLEGRFFAALGQLLAHREAEGDLHSALHYAQRGVRIDPLREDAHRDLMRLYAAAGQPAEALRQYGELEQLLQQQLAATPDAATRALARDIERRLAASPAARVPARQTPAASTDAPATPDSRPLTAGSHSRIVLLYKHHEQPDEQLVKLLETQLAARGHAVFVDRHATMGVAWARELERQVRGADAVIVLLSRAAAQSEMLAYEAQMAHEAAQQHGRPRLLPVRIHDAGPLPEPLAGILDPMEASLWHGPQDDTRLAEELAAALQEPGPLLRPAALSPPVAPRDRLEPVGGAVPLDSAFYVVRPTDEHFRCAMARGDSIVLVKGARQMGKTSLLARGLQQAREAGARVIRTDFQLLDMADLEAVERLMRVLAEWIAEQLDLEVLPEQVWRPHLGASVNFTRYLRRELLQKSAVPVVWGLDEVDRLFSCDFGSQVFGMFRSWHNDRVLDPAGPWSRLTLAMAYATEHHLFISDLNQSPFNVGTRLTLEDFSAEEVTDLNRRFGSPLRDEMEIARLVRLVGGHPYLVHRALHEMAAHGIGIAALEAQADRNEGIFGDHLRRLLISLVRDPALCDVVRAVLRGAGGGGPFGGAGPRGGAGGCPTEESFYRLRSAGVLAGDSASDARPRCQLYATYLDRYLK